jgi:hypothetical protein
MFFHEKRITMKPWQTFKKGFSSWEVSAAQYVDNLLSKPSILGPAASLLTAATKAKALSNKISAQWWSTWGLPTRQDQERSLHKLNQLESRLLDLEEQLSSHAQRKPDSDR